MAYAVASVAAPFVGTFPRVPFDAVAYRRESQTGRCFICSLVGRDALARETHTVIFENAGSIVFLNRFPTVYGQTLVCPKRHVEHATGDFSEQDYLFLQRLIYRVSEALRCVIHTERVYLLSLGSQHGHPHVHWHVAPLPPGTPPDEEQLAALDCRRGILAIPAEHMAGLASRIREQLDVH
jgi:diadenosine tetraphosphate (Ap4A) HIT family hydrolase